MTKAYGFQVLRMCFTLVLLLMPASSQELRRDAPQTPSTQNPATVDAQDEKNAEQARWDSINSESDAQKYKTFLLEYPRGRFADAARTRLSALLGENFVALFMKRIEANRHWANVEKQLLRRADLIPEVFETLLAAGVQEQEFASQMAETRSALLTALNSAPQGDGNAKTPEQKRSVIEADNSLNKTLQGLETLLEYYPQLRSNVNFLRVRDELTGVENRIAVARMDYNNAAVDYNTARTEPRMAGSEERHGFTEEPYFKSEHGIPVEPKMKRAS